MILLSMVHTCTVVGFCLVVTCAMRDNSAIYKAKKYMICLSSFFFNFQNYQPTSFVKFFLLLYKKRKWYIVMCWRLEACACCFPMLVRSILLWYMYYVDGWWCLNNLDFFLTGICEWPLWVEVYQVCALDNIINW